MHMLCEKPLSANPRENQNRPVTEATEPQEWAISGVQCTHSRTGGTRM